MEEEERKRTLMDDEEIEVLRKLGTRLKILRKMLKK
jgi:hypothetical protein